MMEGTANRREKERRREEKEGEDDVERREDNYETETTRTIERRPLPCPTQASEFVFWF
jgi:hypothetical protein